MLLNVSSEIYAWARGALLILFLYNLILFLQNKRKLFLYYSLYLLCFFVFFLKSAPSLEGNKFFNDISHTVLFIGFAFYVEFSRDLLDTKKFIPDWDKLLKLTTVGLMIIAFLFFIIRLEFGYNYQIKLLLIISPILTLFSILTYFVFTKIKGLHVTFFIIGSLAYLILANINLIGLNSVGEEYFTKRGINPLIFSYLGVLIETTMFAMILGFRIRSVEKSKAETEGLLAKKTKEMSDLKMTMLQSQMDPHFLYNSLNSINNFVLQNDKEKASDYITKFARLIREILKNSAHLTIPLKDELGILALYVKLEQLRMADGFDYIVTIDESINLEEIKVPPLFMQPFIENAIWHGFANKKSDKVLTLSIYDEEDKIRCEIIDNGVGIDKTKYYKREESSRKPFGLKASEDRIKLLHENKNVYVIIEDISGVNRTGTKVTLKFPKSI